MRFKRVLIILMLTVLLFCIAGVSAADANDTATAGADDGAIEPADENLKIENDESEAIGADEPVIDEADDGKFSTLQQKISNAPDNATIIFENDYAYDDGFSKDGIAITKPMTIDGKGHTIDAKSKGRIFTTGTSNVVFKNIIFVNGSANGNGGAIDGDNHKSINCTFKNNHAVESGGALHGGEAYYCTFTGNYADDCGGAMYDGSAVDCTFTGNHADWGGAIEYGSAVNCTFTGNYADEYGGAIDEGSAVNCIFTSNHADYGGAMYGGSAVLCIYENNENYNTGHLNIFHVHDIYGSGEKLLLDLRYENYTFNGFKVTIRVYKANNLFGTYNALTGDEWSVDLPRGFYTATVTVDHPDIDPANIKITVIGQGLSFWNLNQAINANSNSTIDLYDDYVFNETTDSAFRQGIEISRDVTIDGHGLIIDAKESARIFNVVGGHVVFKNIIFINGKADGKGGAIIGSNYTVVGCTFYNNRATGSKSYGGAMYGGSARDCTFTNNGAYGEYGDGQGCGGAMCDGSAVDCTFTNNVVDGENGWGGAMYGGSAVDCTFTGNRAEGGGEGGAMYGGSAVNCTFTDNYASFGGGAMYGGSADSCIFTNNDWRRTSVDSPTLTVGNLKFAYKSGEKLTFNLTTHGGMPINDGIIKISISTPDHVEIGTYTCLSGEGWTVDLPVGNYFAAFSTDYAGFQGFRKTIMVSAANTVIYADAISSVYNVDKNLVITLKDAKGNPLSGFKLTVNLNGVKSLTTDKNGQVKVSTKGLIPKAYTAKIAFDGNANYAKSTKEVKVTVKKATPKLTAKNKKFKVKKAKKYTVTLKSNVGKAMNKVKLTLKVGKKTYTAKTNKKGQATFNLKKLTKKGKYNAVITYKGDKFYNKVTKKVKITVK